MFERTVRSPCFLVNPSIVKMYCSAITAPLGNSQGWDSAVRLVGKTAPEWVSGSGQPHADLVSRLGRRLTGQRSQHCTIVSSGCLVGQKGRASFNDPRDISPADHTAKNKTIRET